MSACPEASWLSSTLVPAKAGIEALRLQGSEQLLDGPALAVPVNDLQCIVRARNVMRGDQHPAHRINARRRIGLTRRHQPDGNLIGQASPRSADRPGKAHGIETDGNLSAALLLPGFRANFDLGTAAFRQAHGMGEKLGPANKIAVLGGADEEMAVAGARHGEQIVNVALPVADHRDHGGVFKGVEGLPGALDPARRFLIFERPPALGRNLAGPLPRAPAGKPGDTAACGIGHEHRMDEKAKVRAVSSRSKPAHAPRMRLMVDLAGILDRQHVPAAGTSGAVAGRGPEHLARRHMRAVEKARIPHFAGVPAAEAPQADGAFGTHPPQQSRAPFLRRRSPK